MAHADRRSAKGRLLSFAAFAFLLALAFAPQAQAGGGGQPKVVAGTSHTCAMTDRGTVWCWGDNSFGQLGTGDTAPQSAPVPVPGLTEVKSVGAYGFGTCAVKHDGTVWCWGANDLGQLGQGTQDADPHPTPVQVQGVEDTYWITGGSAHLCSVTWQGTVSCWGSNSDGQLANGGVGGFNGTATAIVGVSEIHSVSAGANFTCISTKLKKVRCAGANGAGQLGDVAFGPNSGALVEVPGQEGIYEVRSGATFVCGLSWSAEGHRCWGDNALGQLGQGVLAAPLGGSEPPAAPTLSIKQLGGTAGATCAKLKSRRVACWGDGTAGALGLGSEAGTDTPTALALENVAAISSSSTSRTQCAIVRGGELHCWGLNDFGQAGVGGAPAPVLTPALVPGLDLVTRPQYPEGAWIEPTSQVRKNKSGTKWILKSRVTVEPSAFVFPEQACKGIVAADMFYWRKVSKRGATKSGGDKYELRKVGVRTKSKLRLSGGLCKANFVQRMSIAKFAKYKRRLRISATGFGNDVQSKFSTGEFELKNINRGKK
ncbi:MAG: hypothetical protein HZB14_08200 [Actinobacteria bacterium]|nr:hypothetical protein [Actinomycetota bacterium]